MSHKFRLHQLVRLVNPGYLGRGASASDVFEVVRLMPADQSGEYSYRIKASAFGERAVRESEIMARRTDP